MNTTMDNTTDQDLMKLVKREGRDQFAVSTLIRRYRADVLEFCNSIAPGKGEYRTEEVFYVAIKRPHSIRPDENVCDWLIRIAQRAHENHKVREEFERDFINTEVAS